MLICQLVTKPLNSASRPWWNNSLSSLATFGKDFEAFKGIERIFIEACLTKCLDCLSIIVLGFVAFACFFVKSFPLEEPSGILKLIKKKERLIKIPQLT